MLDPYHMACLDGAWYLIAKCHKRGKVLMFVPERMGALKQTGVIFPPPNDFNFDHYMSGAFRVIRDDKPYKVWLRFTGGYVPFIAERR